ncbi:Calcineurin-like phosphoesterase [Formosa sp. Hel1_31_208]|uniref:metallophosphoesterase n=1 Tax=Formosa sp. Hel1_31_208 TaxID=1798225 RepID=UPI00087AF685|nr:metallophosphoesterase [Formosa sp. Hel1_31_208]SDS30634.1 Calcineurin-like phosphoesterase [Formosa sp. Hel1_31_208]
MKIHKLIISLLIAFACYPSFGQDLNDGPYIFIESNHLIQKTIINGKVISKELELSSYDTIYPPETSVFTNVEKVAVLSDIHGQYDLAIAILKNNHIIDEDLNWSFGSGHFVIVGDVFDRGPKVNEMLWLIYKLEQQAKQNGGQLHFLLGNHEYMILHKDLRYLNEKYISVSDILNKGYDELYDNNTILGRWLRSKSTVLKINDTVFVHGGISQEFLSKTAFDIVAINEAMRVSIDKSKSELKATGFYNTYYGTSGLIWYRGYFNDDLKDDDIDTVLSQTHSEHIVVGHCSFDEIISAYDNKIFGVDSSIKKGRYGELLFIENGKHYRATKDGTKIEFN